MQTNIPEKRKSQPVRAVIEIIEGRLKIYPIANSDADERRILDALRFVAKEDEAIGR